MSAAKASAAAEIEMRGFVIDEMAEYALRDVVQGLELVALLCEEREGDMPEATPQMWAGLLRTFSRQVDDVRTGAGWAGTVPVSKRSVN